MRSTFITMLVFLFSGLYQLNAQQISNYASNLNTPVGLNFHPDGDLWTVQTGTGNDDGKVSIINTEGAVTDVITGLPSLFNPNSNEIIGPWHAYHLPGDQLLVVSGEGEHPLSATLLTYDLSTFTPGDTPLGLEDYSNAVNIGAYVLGEGYTQTNPYSVAWNSDGDLFVADAAANAIIKVDGETEEISTFAVFPDFENPTPVGPPMVNAVPTKIISDGADGFYVGTLTGFPFVEGAAMVKHLSADGVITDYASGLTMVVDLAIDPTDGNLVVLEFASFGLGQGFIPGSSQLVRIIPNMANAVIAKSFGPASGLAFGQDGTAYVSSIFTGQVLEVEFIAAPNDNFCDAIPVTIGADCSEGYNINTNYATPEVNEPSVNCGGFSVSSVVENSVWFSFVATGEPLYISALPDQPLNGSNYQIQLFSSNGECEDLSNLELMECSVTKSLQSSANIFTTLEEGLTYYIQVSGVKPAFNPFAVPFSDLGCLTISEISTPINDNICDAIEVSLDAPAGIYSNLGATVEEGEAALTPPFSPNFLGVGNDGWSPFSTIGNSVWFTFTTPAEGGDISVDLLGSNQLPGGFVTQLAVYEASSCEDLSQFSVVAAADNSIPEGGGLLSVNSKIDLYCLPGNTTYYVIVDGGTFPFGSFESQGFFSIEITNPDPIPITFSSLVEAPDCADDNNGTIIIQPQGGGKQYTYEWSNGSDAQEQIGVLEAGTYTLTVTDQCGVSVVESFELPAGKNNDLSSDAGSDIIACLGDEIPLQVNASGGSLFDTKRMFYQAFAEFGTFDMVASNLYFPSDQEAIATAQTLRFNALEFVGTQLYGVDNTGMLHQINSTTGEATAVGTLDIPVLDLSYVTSANQLYAIANNGDLYTVDAGSGATSFVTSMVPNPDQTFIIQAVVDQDGIAYLIYDSQLHSFDINTSTPGASIPFTVNPLAIRGMEIDPFDNKLYVTLRTVVSQVFGATASGWSSTSEVNKTTGEVGPSYRDFTVQNALVSFAIAPRSTAPYQYSWAPGGQLDDPNIDNPIFIMDQATVFNVTTTDVCGNTSTAEVAVEQQMENCPVDIELSISVDNLLYNQYENVLYSITVTNSGFNPASGVTVSAELPTGMVYTNHSASQGAYELFFETWDVGTLAAGQTEVLTLELFTLIGEVEIDNFVQVMTTNEPDNDSTPGNGLDNPDNEDDEAKITIKPASDGGIGTGDGTADLSLDINAETSTYDNYEHINVTYTITNDGPDDATGIIISMPEPNNAKYAGENNPVNISAGNFNLFYETWSIDNLPSGSSASLTLDIFTLGASDDITCFAQVFIVNENDPDSAPANNSGSTPNEDDEAALVLSAQNAGADQFSLQQSGNVTTASSNYRLFPNPTSGQLSLTVDKAGAQSGFYSVVSIDGKVLKRQAYNFVEGYNELKLNVSDLENGLYFIQIDEKDGHTQHLRFTKMSK